MGNNKVWSLPLYMVLSVLSAMSFVSETASAAGNLNIGLGINYNSRGQFGYMPAYGGGIFGYGAGYGSIGAIGGVCGGYGGGLPAPILMPPTPPAMPGYPGPCQMCAAMGGGFGPGFGGPGFGGGMFPPMPSPIAARPVPPPAPMLPPHIALQNQGWGPGWGSFPGPVIPGPGFGPNCAPCGMGMPPVAMGSVMGGPAIAGGGYYQMGSGGGGGAGVIVIGGGNEWEKNDTANILWSTAIGLGLQASNVYPVAVPRYQPTFTPMWYGGDRESDLIPRPHAQ